MNFLRRIFLEQKFTARETTIDVHNAAVNAVLEQKFRKARRRGIAILLCVNDLSGLWIGERDLAVLLSELLDNAIAACERLKKRKIIRLKLVRERRQFVLSVQNRVDNPVRIRGKRVRPPRSGGGRLRPGLKNVRRILEKYEAMSAVRCEGGWFYYTAVVPQKGKNKNFVK